VSTPRKKAAPTERPVDPEPQEVVIETPPPLAVGKTRIRITKSALSVEAGGAHYTLRAGDIMNLDGTAAADLVRQGLATEV